MKRMIFTLTVICFLCLSVQAFAVEATIVDKKDVEVKLTSVETKIIDFDVGDFHLFIPVAAINTIRLAEDEKTLIVQTVTGIKGTLAKDLEVKLEGTWELGKYSVALSDIKSVRFVSSAQPQQEATMVGQPDGFYAICTDWTGATMEVFGFRYWFSWWYSSPYWNVRDRMNYESRTYLPIKYKEAIVGIPFTDIDTIKFTDNKREERMWEPTLTIKLVDGSILTGKLAQLGEYAPRFAGEVKNRNLVERISQIVFDHKRDKNAPRVVPGSEDISGNLNSVYTISIKTWQGNQVILLNGCQFFIHDGYGWGYKQEQLETNFDMKIGESSNVVGFDNIKSIQFREKGKPEAQLTTTSGKTIDISLSDYQNWLGGNWDKFGPTRIAISEVSSFEISRNVDK